MDIYREDGREYDPDAVDPLKGVIDFVLGYAQGTVEVEAGNWGPGAFQARKALREASRAIGRLYGEDVTFRP